MIITSLFPHVRFSFLIPFVFFSSVGSNLKTLFSRQKSLTFHSVKLYPTIKYCSIIKKADSPPVFSDLLGSFPLRLKLVLFSRHSPNSVK